MNQKESRFSACHPAVCFSFFIIAIVGSVFFQHPAYLLVSVISAIGLQITEKGRRALPMVLGMLPMFLFLSAINPLFNTSGERILFTVFGRPYTLEALFYGMAISGMLIGALQWFSCYSAVITSDKLTCLLGNVIPALSLILVMVLRLIPSYQRKAAQISGARRCIGKSAASADHWQEKVNDGMTVLSSLTSWALEGAIITADSMRSRGYGADSNLPDAPDGTHARKRSSFQIYRWQITDYLLLAAILILFALMLLASAFGWTAAAYTPALEIAPVSGGSVLGIIAYGVLLFIPTIMNLTEELKWKYFQSKI